MTFKEWIKNSYDLSQADEEDAFDWSDLETAYNQGKKETYKEIYDLMTKRSSLEIPTVQDNWIFIIRKLEKLLR